MEIITLIGYHGTTNYFAENIIRENKFHISTKDNEWLGKGIYFWEDEQDGIWWANLQYERQSKKDNSHTSPYVIKCQLNCLQSEYINLETDMNKLAAFAQQYEIELYNQGKKRPNFKNQNERKNFYCTLFKRHYNIKIMVFPFHYIPHNCVGFPQYEEAIKRTQICVSDNNNITILYDKE